MIKKLFTIVAISLLLAGCGAVEEASAEEAKFETKIGTEVSFLFDKDVHMKNADLDAELKTKKALVVGELEINDIFSILPKVGYFDGSLETANLELESESAIAYGIGMELLLGNLQGVDFTLEGDYLRANPDLDSANYKGIEVKVPVRSDITYNEWGIGVLASKTFGVLTPAVGVEYRSVDIDANVDLGMFKLGDDIESNDNVNVITKLDAQVTDNLLFTVGARFIGEVQGYGQLAYNF